MAKTYDLIQEDFAEIKITADCTIKMRLLKRKDRPAFLKLQKDLNEKKVAADFDMVEMVRPYILEESLEAFKAIENELSLWQIGKLSDAFFDMNGLSFDEALAKVQADAEPTAEPAKEEAAQ